MKLYLLALTLSVGFVTNSLMGMDTQKKYLVFMLDDSLKITECDSKGMDFYCPPSEFMGKNILDTIPLSPEDKNNLVTGFAVVKSSPGLKVLSPYMLKDKKFVAKIGYSSSAHSLFVRVRQAKNVQK